MSTTRTAVISGVGLALAGVTDPTDLLRTTAAARPEPFDTAAVIGRRGHRYKDRATRLALCAAVHALRDAGLTPDGGRELAVPGESVGVVASSNLGNLDTVCQITAQIAEEGTGTISPMATPNASSNVVASTVAIHFGLRGPNIMLCNGPTSGLDAVHWAATLIAAGRLRRALVIGVETGNDIVGGLLGRDPRELLDGAAALVVEATDAARDRGADPAAVLGPHTRRGDLRSCVAALLPGPGGPHHGLGPSGQPGAGEAGPAAAPPGIWFTPEGYEPGPGTAPVPDTVPRHDVSRGVGPASGALGVLQCAAAAGWLATAADGRRALITTGDDASDGVAGLLLTPHGAS